MEPLDIGFMVRDTKRLVFQDTETHGYVIFESLRPKDGDRDKLLGLLRDLSSIASRLGNIVASFWCLGYRTEDNDPTIVVFQRFESKAMYEQAYLGHAEISQKLYVPDVFSCYGQLMSN